MTETSNRAPTREDVRPSQIQYQLLTARLAIANPFDSTDDAPDDVVEGLKHIRTAMNLVAEPDASLSDCRPKDDACWIDEALVVIRCAGCDRRYLEQNAVVRSETVVDGEVVDGDDDHDRCPYCGQTTESSVRLGLRADVIPGKEVNDAE